MPKKYSEIKKELKFVFKDKNYFDLLILPIIFVTSNFILGFDIAVIVVILVSIIILIYRFYKKEKIKYSVIGFLGTLLLILITNLSGQQKTYFAPSLISSAATSVLCIISLFFKKPLVAYTSSIARRWPIKWYWHDKVRPAYSEVTLMWSVYFLLRFLIQLRTLNLSTQFLAIINAVTGLPSTIVLLIASYIYGSWRLKTLKGPSVAEFKNNKRPPWKSQRKGF